MKLIYRNSILLLIIFAFIWKDFVSVSYQVDYFMNQQKYLQKCVNKAKPNLQCNGKCQLALRLKKIESDAKTDLNKHQSQQPFKFRELEAYAAFDYLPFFENKFNLKAEEISLNQSYSWFYHYDFSSKTFHPPLKLIA